VEKVPASQRLKELENSILPIQDNSFSGKRNIIMTNPTFVGCGKERGDGIALQGRRHR